MPSLPHALPQWARSAMSAAYLTFVCFVGAPEALAQSAAPVATDIVRLASGAEYKGQIAERVPDSHVVIVTLTGETKRFEWSEVAFAGAIATPPAVQTAPAEPAPAAPPPPPAASPAATGLRLELQANHQGLMWHARDAAGTSRMLCMAPCATNLRPGRYELGLSSGSRTTAWHVDPLEIRESGQWNGEYTSRRGSRIAGGVVLGVGLAASLGLLAGGIKSNNDADNACSSSALANDACDATDADSPGTPAIVVGVIGLVASAVIGIALLSRKDSARISRGGPVLNAQGTGAEPQPEPPPVMIAEAPTYAKTVWSCIDDDDITKADLTIEVDGEGKVARVVDVLNVGWSTRTCVRNNLPGQVAGGKAGTRAVSLTR